MKTSELLVSGLNITEDEYSYKGLCILSSGERRLQLDITELDSSVKLAELAEYFSLEESGEEIRKILMELIMEKAAIGSKVTEGEKYEEKSGTGEIDRAIKTMDRA